MTALTEIAAQAARGDAAGAHAQLSAMLGSAGLDAAHRAAVLVQRARVLQQLRDLAGAAADLEQAVELAPGDARAFADLGIVRSDLGDLPGAIASFARAVECDATNSRAWNNLGNAQWQSGAIEASIGSFRQAVARDPGYALAWANLGSVLRSIDRRADAESALTRALQLNPELPSALSALGTLNRDRGRIDDAIECYARAAKAAPQDALHCTHLARLLAERDDLAGARRVYVEAARRDPRMLRAWMGQHLLLPQTYQDSADVDTSRDAYAAGLTILERGLPEVAVDMRFDARLDSLRWSNFLLAYQGRDDRELQQRYGRMLAGILAPGAPAAPLARARGQRIRIGFVSAFFRESTVGHYFLSWITDLPRAVFDVHVYHLHGSDDPLVQRLRAAADVFRDCPRLMPSRVAQMIRADALDVLVYPELGMDATTFVLGALRLAPLQCAGWGHPVTTGHPAIDVFFSSDAMEPDGAEASYSERLVRLPGIGTRYAMPAAPADGTRAQFDLPQGRTLLLCPQSLFKVLPDDDALFARILAQAPEAALVMCNGRNTYVTERHRQRLAGTLRQAGVDPRDRVYWLPSLGHDDYLRANTVCDAMLDTTHWSGGNTSIDAIAAGLPIVTLEGEFMRSRQSAAMLRLAGAADLIAQSRDDYVARALRLVRDPAWRARMAAMIVQGRPRIFDDPQPVPALAQSLQQLCADRG